MPLTLAEEGVENIIKRIGGSPEVKKHLENLGFVAGGTVTVITTMAGNVIVNVKEARVAISKEMAQKILICICLIKSENKKIKNRIGGKGT